MGINGLFKGFLVSGVFLFGSFGCYNERPVGEMESVEKNKLERVLDDDLGIGKDEGVLERDLIYSSDSDDLDDLDDLGVRDVFDVLGVSYEREELDYKVYDGELFNDSVSDEIGIDIRRASVESVPKRELWEFPDDSDSLWLESLLSSRGLIKMASFNVQVFGKSKRSDREVMDVLSDIVREFDIVAIQELRDESEMTLPFFVDRINEGDRKYDFVGSSRIGRTKSKERYGFIYDRELVSLSGSYIFDDSEDIFERDPFVCSFSSNEFDYVLVNVHVKPEDARKEIMGLEEVVEDASSRFFEGDVIVLGDFNSDGSYFSESDKTGIRDVRYYWAIGDEVDTTLGLLDLTYDRIVFRNEFTFSDFTGESGVFRFDEVYGLDREFAKRVSDHYPVWAEFYIGKDED
jgi:endonuclease/exonuclease/phosphatase family metal-dependent hydrolase